MERDAQREPEHPALTHDYIYPYRGYWAPGGRCRVRIYQAEGQTPVVLVSELPDNENTSITNLAEYLAAELIVRHFPQRFEEEDPVVWIEHYPRTPEEQRQGMPVYARVEFASYRPRKRFVGGVDRIAIGTPHWTHLTEAELRELLNRLTDGAGM